MYNIDLIEGRGYSGSSTGQTINDSIRLVLGNTNTTWQIPHERVACIEHKKLDISIVGGKPFYDELKISGALRDGVWDLKIVEEFALREIFKWFSTHPFDFFEYLEIIKKTAAYYSVRDFKLMFREMFDIYE